MCTVPWWFVVKQWALSINVKQTGKHVWFTIPIDKKMPCPCWKPLYSTQSSHKYGISAKCTNDEHDFRCFRSHDSFIYFCSFFEQKNYDRTRLWQGEALIKVKMSVIVNPNGLCWISCLILFLPFLDALNHFVRLSFNRKEETKQFCPFRTSLSLSSNAFLCL